MIILIWMKIKYFDELSKINYNKNLNFIENYKLIMFPFKNYEIKIIKSNYF